MELQIKEGIRKMVSTTTMDVAYTILWTYTPEKWSF
jgi:hypothetical protein